MVFLPHWHPGRDYTDGKVFSSVLSFVTKSICGGTGAVCKNRLRFLHAILSNYVAIKIPKMGLLKPALG